MKKKITKDLCTTATDKAWATQVKVIPSLETAIPACRHASCNGLFNLGAGVPYMYSTAGIELYSEDRTGCLVMFSEHTLDDSNCHLQYRAVCKYP